MTKNVIYHGTASLTYYTFSSVARDKENTL